ncbi:MAG: hypothetical protein K2P92_02675 [Bdellovibrionaceae bacterium]|nr:hypothetical protein [Pseudobdellovibrionaceae bacterium]
MLSLKPFFRSTTPAALTQDISITADLTLMSANTAEINFKWMDPKGEIVLPEKENAGRIIGLWESTCFEAFIQPAPENQPQFVQNLTAPVRYYETNFSTAKSWNVFGFTDYRTPTTPTELVEAKILSYDVQSNQMKIVLQVDGADWRKVSISLCAVIVTRSYGKSYWSFKHADDKANFHHFESFIIERSLSEGAST